MSFKIGDKVRVLSDSSNVRKFGDVGIISDIKHNRFNTSCDIKFETADEDGEYDWCLYECELELVKEEPIKEPIEAKSAQLKFKVGDKVEIVKSNEFKSIGEVGIIIEFDGTLTPYKVEFNNLSRFWFSDDYLKLVIDVKEEPIKELIEETPNEPQSLFYYKNHDIILNADLDKVARDNNMKYINRDVDHTSIDNLFQDSLLDNILDEFPKSDSDYEKWDIRNDKDNQIKLRSNWQSSNDIPPNTFKLISFLNSDIFLKFLTKLTNIEGLIADPYLDGGGMNEIKRGGKLAIHCDGNKNKRMNLYRALNVIIYLNKDWLNEYGGHLNLYNENATVAMSYLPIFNRMVIFTTNEKSLHGHPQPLNCPNDMSRKSLILYYYTADNRFNNSLDKDTEFHSAKFQK